MEDIRIMRRTSVRQVKVDVTGTSLMALPANSRRVAVVIGSHENDVVKVQIVNSGTNNLGVIIPMLGDALKLDLVHYGQIVTQPFYLSSPNTPGTVVIFETVLEDE